MKQIVVSILLFLLFSTSAVSSLQLIPATSAASSGLPLTLSMPIEHVNYTITRINGTFWALIDGNYPIYIQNQPTDGFSGDLPMVYPMPPQATNIHVYLDNRELAWSNYTTAYPFELHHTAVGEWWMIYSVIENASDHFTLNIHYEHPLQQVNGSYLFLYDLNISPYLSPQNNNSTAYFIIRLDSNIQNLKVYTTETDSKWNPMNYTVTSEGSVNIVSIRMDSEYGQLPLGDLVVAFSEAESSFWVLPVLADIILVALLLFIKRHKVISVASKLHK